LKQLRSMLEDELSVLTEACVKLQRREQSLADDNQRFAREAQVLKFTCFTGTKVQIPTSCERLARDAQALRLQLSEAGQEVLAVRVQLAGADEGKKKEARDAKAQAQVRQVRLQ
jgi:hypothetical protein